MILTRFTVRIFYLQDNLSFLCTNNHFHLFGRKPHQLMNASVGISLSSAWDIQQSFLGNYLINMNGISWGMVFVSIACFCHVCRYCRVWLVWLEIRFSVLGVERVLLSRLYPKGNILLQVYLMNYIWLQELVWLVRNIHAAHNLVSTLRP